MPKKITPEIKKQVLDFIEKMEIEVQDLESYHIDKNPYCLPDYLAYGSDLPTWSEEEEWQAKIQKAKYCFEVDGAAELLDIPDEMLDDAEQGIDTTITNEVIEYIETLEK